MASKRSMSLQLQASPLGRQQKSGSITSLGNALSKSRRGSEMSPLTDRRGSLMPGTKSMYLIIRNRNQIIPDNEIHV